MKLDAADIMISSIKWDNVEWEFMVIDDYTNNRTVVVDKNGKEWIYSGTDQKND